MAKIIFVPFLYDAKLETLVFLNGIFRNHTNIVIQADEWPSEKLHGFFFFTGSLADPVTVLIGPSQGTQRKTPSIRRWYL